MLFYINDGMSQEVQLHFTYYGFRYVKLEGINEIYLNDFKGWVLYSDMKLIGESYLCKVLSKNGYHDRACKILVNQQYPG